MSYFTKFWLQFPSRPCEYRITIHQPRIIRTDDLPDVENRMSRSGNDGSCFSGTNRGDNIHGGGNRRDET